MDSIIIAFWRNMFLPIDPHHMHILCFNIYAKATFIWQNTYGRGLLINIQLDKQKTGDWFYSFRCCFLFLRFDLQTLTKLSIYNLIVLEEKQHSCKGFNCYHNTSCNFTAILYYFNISSFSNFNAEVKVWLQVSHYVKTISAKT